MSRVTPSDLAFDLSGSFRRSRSPKILDVVVVAIVGWVQDERRRTLHLTLRLVNSSTREKGGFGFSVCPFSFIRCLCAYLELSLLTWNERTRGRRNTYGSRRLHRVTQSHSSYSGCRFRLLLLKSPVVFPPR